MTGAGDEGAIPPETTRETGEVGRITMTDGRFVVDADLIAAAFGIPVAATRALMRDGAITSRAERGEGSDAGRHRLTFHYRGRACRFIVDGEGRILKRLCFDVPPKAADMRSRAGDRGGARP